jgi:hypothetical protein
MTQKENKIWKYIGIIVIAYFMLWFLGPMFNKDQDLNVYQYQPMFDYSPKSVQTPQGPMIQYVNGYGHDSNPQNDDVPVTNPNPQLKVEVISEPTPINDGDMGVCTMDAKICADGSAVGRSGPNCEFAPCPGN